MLVKSYFAAALVQFFHSFIGYLGDFNKWKDYVCSFVIIGYGLPSTYQN